MKFSVIPCAIALALPMACCTKPSPKRAPICDGDIFSCGKDQPTPRAPKGDEKAPKGDAKAKTAAAVGYFEGRPVLAYLGMLTSFCGDGTLDAGEQCDDGNIVNNDGCSSACNIEFCGDGVEQTSEECDDGNVTNGDGCSSVCLDEVAVCGDAIVQTWGGEECDDGGVVNGDGCSSTCQDEPPVCGDGLVWGGEECDDGNVASNDGCSSTCLTESCGDGIVQTSEECDGSAACPAWTTSGAATCNASCELDQSGCFYSSSGTIYEPGEGYYDFPSIDASQYGNIWVTASRSYVVADLGAYPTLTSNTYFANPLTIPAAENSTDLRIAFTAAAPSNYILWELTLFAQ